jgi:hypothetical protein
MAERLALHSVTAPSGCRIWIAARSEAGYGRLATGYAHRLSYETHVGPIPPGMQIDHLCRRRACIRPEHLQAVSIATNSARSMSIPAMNARRTYCLRGHAFAEHGFIDGRGNRACRPCSRERWRAASRRRYAAVRSARGAA